MATFCAVDGLLTLLVPNASDVVGTLSTACVALPNMVMVFIGAFGSLDDTVTVPLRLPPVVGTKRTANLPLAPGASFAGKAILSRVKSPGLVPVRTMSVTSRSEKPLLVMVTVVAIDIAPTLVVANAIDPVSSVTAGGP